MHVVMFSDQHIESLGGAQVSMRLQRRFLERAGHTVTVVAPRMHRAVPGDPAYVDLRSTPATPDREYGFSWPGRRSDREVDASLARRPPIDIVHVQADFWGAFIGHRFAARHGLPVVHTMHNRADVGIEATAPVPGLILRALNAWARAALRPALARRRAERPALDQRKAARSALDQRKARRREASGHGQNDGWAYLRRLARLSDAVTAPSSHFARRLERHGAVPAAGAVDVIWNGIDDELLDAVAAEPAARRPGPPRFVWIGRMSPEKRLLPFLSAVAQSGIVAEVEIIGGGVQLRAARKLVERGWGEASIVFSGRLPYAETLARLADADAVVQTSIGFETQGMTVFEAASLGTPAVVSDPDVAAELGSGTWEVRDASVPALADTLRRAVADIAAGTTPAVDRGIAERFRQSSRTAAMIRVYERTIARARP